MVMTISYNAAEAVSEPVSVAESFVKSLSLLEQAHRRLHDVVKDDDGNVIEILCTYDPESKSGSDTSGRKVKGTIHWVSAEHATEVEVRLYDRLFMVDDPSVVEEGKTFVDHLNPDSLKVVTGYVEPALAKAEVGERVQFERLGYYIVDADSTADKQVFNRIVPLRDTWGKIEAKGKKS